MNTQWVKNAPERLVLAYENRENGPGRVLLERLLRDDRMRLVWAELARHVKTKHGWIKVWSAIASAKARSNKAKLHKRRSDERDKYVGQAAKFASLAKEIENGLLDVPAYNLFPQDVLTILGAPDFHVKDAMQRDAAAHQILHCWPTAPEILRGMERCALAQADEEMKNPRAVTRGRGNIVARTFVWNLGQEFQYMFGHAMLGTLATIADVILQTDQPITKGFVQSALKGV